MLIHICMLLTRVQQIQWFKVPIMTMIILMDMIQ